MVDFRKMKDTINKVLEITYNFAQLMFLLAKQPIKILEWGRGTGKSTILAKAIIDFVTELPRSTGVMVAETYAQIKTRTLPSTISGLEQHGIIKDLHYFVGKKPPASWNWPEPIEPPLDYSQAIIFWNGTVMIFQSQDGGAVSGRGLNVDWIVGDESARLSEEKFYTDTLLTNRGGLYKKAVYPDGTWKYYKDVSCHHGVVLATSTPVTVAGRWIFKFEEQAIMEPEKVVFLRASAEVNRHNLGDDYFELAKATMPQFLYDAEVRNIRITQVDDGFYPKLNEQKHTYINFNNDYFHALKLDSKTDSRGDADLLADKPLIAGIDWGANINCMVVCQHANNELKFIKNIYVKFPQIIDDMINNFIDYYLHHPTKVLYLWYDATGNNRQANASLTYAEAVKQQLESKGWTVVLMTEVRVNESHLTKYQLWNKLLDEGSPTLPSIRFNRYNCQELWISMTNAPATQGYNEAIRKNKGSERKKNLAQEHATHFSDAADVVVVGMFVNGLNQASSSVPIHTITR